MSRVTVPDDYAGMRLDRFAGKVAGGLPRNLIARRIRSGEIRVNGLKSGPEARLCAGDLVTMPAERETAPPQASARPEGRLDVLYEDDDIIAVSKPAGLLSQPARGDDESLSDMLAKHVALAGRDPWFRAGVLWRLDRNVTGLVMAAKNPKAARELSAAISAGELRKTYAALCAGEFPDRLAAISRAGKDRRQNLMSPGGDIRMEAEYFAVSRGGGASLVKACLLTGRSHQIRFQLSQAGHPVLGDFKYSDGPGPLGRPMLHCTAAVLPGGRTFTCPFPPDFIAAARSFGIAADSADFLP